MGRKKMDLISFTIHHNPTPKGRPRFAKGRTYTPKKTTDYQNIVKQSAPISTKKDHKGPIQANIVFYIKRPKYMLHKKYENRIIPHTKKPDIDNLAKAILDALNGTLYIDDSQIYSLNLTKFYCDKEQDPKVVVTLIYQDK